MVRTVEARTSPIHSYDLYLSRDNDEDWDHVGSMVLAAFRTRKNNKESVVLYILSFTAVTKGSGYGYCMYEICERLARGHCENTSEALICALCVDHTFWANRMDITADAKSIIFQLLRIDSDTYKIYTGCTARTRVVPNPDLAQLSPV